MVNQVVKVLKPPYKIHDLPALLGILLLFLIIPTITFNLSKTGTQEIHAAALPCPNFGNFGDVNGDGVVTSVGTTSDAQLALDEWSRVSAGLPSVLTADQKKRADVDGNGKIEQIDGISIRRYAEASPQQITFKVCAENDGDGFPNVVENYLGTQQYFPCGTNAWPPDLNNDQKVNIQDVTSFIAPIRRIDTKKGDANFSQRYDLNGDGVINQAGDIGGSSFPKGVLYKYFNTSCQILQFPAVLSPATLTGSPNPVIAGDSVTLSWDINGEVTKPCFQGGDGFNGVVDLKGSYTKYVYSPANQIYPSNAGYSIECGGYNGGVIRSTTVTVISPCPTYINKAQLYSSSGKIYVINGSCEKQWVNSPAAMDWCRYDWTKVQTGVSVDNYLQHVKEGAAVGEGSSCPPGPTVPPVPVVTGINPPYNKPIDCEETVGNYTSSHKAVDITCAGGTAGRDVRSVSKGTVIYQGDLDGAYSCGIEVKVETVASDGRVFVFRYCHLAGTAAGIFTGATVSQGQSLGSVGLTGTTTGYHLHLCTELNGPKTCYASSGTGQIDPRIGPIINF